MTRTGGVAALVVLLLLGTVQASPAASVALA